MKKGYLGHELMRRNIVGQIEIDRALKMQEEPGSKKLGELLVDLGAITRSQLLATFSRISKIPLIDLSRYSIDPNVARMLPLDIIRSHRILPLSMVGNILTLAMTDPFIRSSARTVELMLGCKVNRVICRDHDFDKALADLTGPAAGAA